jgi:hypothetical protein
MNEKCWVFAEVRAEKKTEDRDQRTEVKDRGQ